MMKLECQLIADDYVKAQFVHLRPSWIVKWLGVILAVQYMVVIVTLIPWAMRSGEWMPLSLLILVGGWLVLRFFVLLPYKARKVFSQQKSLQEMNLIEIDAEGMVATSAIGHASLKWKDFSKYRKGKDLILAYQSDVIFQMFPRRWFTDAQYTEFEGYLRSALGKPR